VSDPIGAVVMILAGSAAVSDLAGTDIYGGELPAEAVARLPKGMVVVQASGGVSLTQGSYAEHDTQRIDVTCYAKTPREAEMLRKAAEKILRQIRRQAVAGTLIPWIDSAGGSMAGRERDGSWPTAFQSFQVFHCLEEIEP